MKGISPSTPTDHTQASIAGATLLALALAGFLPVSRVMAQEASSSSSTLNQRTQLLAEQTQPQKVVPFDPANFDEFAGYYQRDPSQAVFFHIYRTGDRYYSQITGQMPVEIFPESATEFFATIVAAQLSFDTGTDGEVTDLVLHQNGYLMPWRKVTTAAYDSANAELQLRIAAHIPSPGTEAALRHQIETLSSGNPDYGSMGPELGDATHQQLTQIKALFDSLGTFQSLAFSNVSPTGASVFVATFEHGQLQCLIGPLSSSGKVTGDFFHLLP